jgi:hypothetical protein
MTALLTYAALAVLATSAADARRYVKPFYQDSYPAPRGAHGYEGWVYPDYYCSYTRYPRRVCGVDRRGNERCRVAGWTIEQRCQ